MSLHFMYHPESGSLFTLDSEEEVNKCLEGDPNIEEIDECQYQVLQAEKLF